MRGHKYYSTVQFREYTLRVITEWTVVVSSEIGYVGAPPQGPLPAEAPVEAPVDAPAEGDSIQCTIMPCHFLFDGAFVGYTVIGVIEYSFSCEL